MARRAGGGPSRVQPAAAFGEAGADPGLPAAMGADGARVAGRLARGCRCFVARVGAEISAYAWVSAGSEWIGEVDLRVRLQPGEAYVWNCVTLPPYRRRGLYTALLGEVAGALRHEGVCRLWVATLPTLPHAARGVVAAGFQPAFQVTAVRAGGLRFLVAVADRDAGPELAAARRLLGRRFQLARSEGPLVH